MPNLKNIRIILVRPENPANVGQAARAMKNFGLSRLVLVDSVPHQVQEAYTLGWNAKEILDQASVFSSLKEALADSILAIGFTRRSGHARGEPRSFLEVLPQAMEAASDHSVALVFGNEKNGLSNEELRLCHLPAALPTAQGHGSLNLSHAVAIAGFLIFNQTPESVLNLRKPERFYATQAELEDLMNDFKQVLEALDYQDSEFNDLLTRTLHNLRRLFKKTGLERREFYLFKAFLSRVETSLRGVPQGRRSNLTEGHPERSEGSSPPKAGPPLAEDPSATPRPQDDAGRQIASALSGTLPRNDE